MWVKRPEPDPPCSHIEWTVRDTRTVYLPFSVLSSWRVTRPSTSSSFSCVPERFSVFTPPHRTCNISTLSVQGPVPVVPCTSSGREPGEVSPTDLKSVKCLLVSFNRYACRESPRGSLHRAHDPLRVCGVKSKVHPPPLPLLNRTSSATGRSCAKNKFNFQINLTRTPS